MAVHPREEYTKDEERWIRYGSAPLLATLLLPIIIGVIILLKCVFNHCCVRRTTTKEEMYGLEGRMTMLSTADSSFITLSDNRHDSHTTSVPVAVEVGAKLKPHSDASQHVKAFGADVPLRSEKGVAIPGPSSNSSKADPTEIPPCSSSYEDTRHGNIESRRISDTSKLTSSQGSSELSGSLKRASAQHRQLPDLPPTPMMTLCTGARPPRRSSSVLSHDGTSELYATVGETQFPVDPASKNASHYTQIRDKKSGMGKSSNNNSIVDPSLLNAQVAGSSASSLSVRPRGIEATPSSDSETYASSSSHHPYAKLKKNPASTEHPYARVKAIGANNNDEETDTDNYDLPQFLRGPEGPVPPAAPVPNTSSSMTSRPTSSSVSQSVSPLEGAVAGSGEIGGPVPPRRVGRQWRRSSQPNLQNDNVSNFSGDSQDSRGYTSISVREPLSNIRSQLTANTRSFDSHYATVSDDSEEMYAAIDDPNDANYMRIDQDGQPRRPTWLGGPTVSSPIPERREANSPLPPVPPVPNAPLPEPAQSPTTPPIPVPNSPNSIIKNAGLPVYAQVTKKPKKQQPPAKLPVTPTVSNVSTSSSQQIGREPNVAGTSGGDTVMLKENPIASHHNPTHRSKRAASLMDNTNPMDADTVDSRRWSKADISYSEFEVVRESIFPSSSGAPGNNPRSPGPSNREPGVGASPPLTARQQELLDEDNYNIIPEKTVRGNSSASAAATRNRLDSGNYQIIDHRNVSSTFREIGDSIGHSDHYQEINDRRRPDDDDEGGQLYQEIERPTRNLDEDDDEDDDDGDEFYERVKKPPSAAKGKKHGYEKIKKKNIPGNLSGVVPAYLSDEDDEDDERPDELYERVKYPPYERLKESKDDLYDSEDAKSKSDYEDIGYSRVKSKQKAKTSKEQRNRPLENAGQGDGASVAHANVEDVSQLYAQVDKSKKRKGSSTCPVPSPKPLVNSNTEITNSSDNTVHHEIYVNNNEPTSKSSHCTSEPMEGHEHLYSKVAKISKADKAKNKNSGCASEREQNCLVNDRNIEYL